MLINEIISNTTFNELHYVKRNDKGRELDYDLVDDLVYFMCNDDDVYRKHVLPAFNQCSDGKNLSILAPTIIACYDIYAKQYPIRELPDTLPKSMIKSVATELCKHLGNNDDEPTQP